MKDVFAWVPLVWSSRIFVLVSLWGATLIVTCTWPASYGRAT